MGLNTANHDDDYPSEMEPPAKEFTRLEPGFYPSITITNKSTGQEVKGVMLEDRDEYSYGISNSAGKASLKKEKSPSLLDSVKRGEEVRIQI